MFRGAGVVLLILLSVAIGFGSIAWFAFNVNDILSNGPKFWNIFWVAFVGLGWVSSIFSRKS